MSDIILKAENISKQYRLGLVGTGTLSHDFNRFWHRIRGKEDPYLQVGALNVRSEKATADYVWALQDINFEVKRGEVLGIIGKNGAGKSTLLKILSRVTSPTTGVIKTNGRIASLLEVGTGFHPEMTGKENIFLNGAILGMTKKEIQSKLEEIIEFSGCKMYIDTPVKRYSSGMRVRLAFAVAAHLEPDILVIDEVLAVGDAEFQKKAIGKMQEISSGEGRTVLFVSHDMSSIQILCKRLIILENGSISYEGDVEKGIRKYLRNDAASKLLSFNQIDEDFKGLFLNSVELLCDTKRTSNFSYNDQVAIKISYSIKNLIENLVFVIRVLDETGNILFTSWDSDSNIKRVEKLDSEYSTICSLPQYFFKKGIYKITLAAHIPRKELITMIDDVVSFEIDEYQYELNESRKGVVLPRLNWSVTEM